MTYSASAVAASLCVGRAGPAASSTRTAIDVGPKGLLPRARAMQRPVSVGAASSSLGLHTVAAPSSQLSQRPPGRTLEART